MMFEPTALEWRDYTEGLPGPPRSYDLFGDVYSVKCLVVNVGVGGAEMHLARLRYVPADDYASDDWQWVMDGRDGYHLDGVIRWAAVTLPEEE